MISANKLEGNTGAQPTNPSRTQLPGRAALRGGGQGSRKASHIDMPTKSHKMLGNKVRKKPQKTNKNTTKRDTNRIEIFFLVKLFSCLK